mmetsp:Transcript_22115/g.54382  ORF Transcript_22115/g.54382 Transcript_22115/m.54382 type:complete len:220 (-) Transcript_22115:1181-1840(-)
MCGRMDSAFSGQSSSVKSVRSTRGVAESANYSQPQDSSSLQPSQKHITRSLYRHIHTYARRWVGRSLGTAKLCKHQSIDRHACLVCLSVFGRPPAALHWEKRKTGAVPRVWMGGHGTTPGRQTAARTHTYIHRIQISPSLAPLCNGSLAEPPTYLPNRELALIVSRLGGPKNRHRRRRRQVVQSRTIRWLHRHARRCEDGCLHVPSLPPPLSLCQACRT